MDGLTRAIDASVGIDTGSRHIVLTFVIAVLIVGSEFRTGFIIIRIGIHLTLMSGIVGLQEIFALGVSDGVDNLIFAIMFLCDEQMSASDGLTCGGMYHHIAEGIRLGLHDGIDISHVIELAHRLCGGCRG